MSTTTTTNTNTNSILPPGSPGQDVKIRAALRRGRRGSVSGESSGPNHNSNSNLLLPRSSTSGSTSSTSLDSTTIHSPSTSSSISSPNTNNTISFPTLTTINNNQQHSPTTISEIIRLCKRSFLFSDVEHDEMINIAKGMIELHVGQGTRVIEQGNEGDFFYVVAQGIFHVMVDGMELPGVEYGPGTCFGELALMYSNPRAATVWCVSATATLYALERETFRNVLCGDRARRREIFEQFLLNLSIFHSQTPLEISRIADVLLETKFAPGEIIVRHGDANIAAMKFFLIVEGEAEAIDSQGSVLRRLLPGEYFGERGLMDRIPRTATVRAITALKCGALDVAAFERLLGENVRKEMRARIESYPISPRATYTSTSNSTTIIHNMGNNNNKNQQLLSSTTNSIKIRSSMGGNIVCEEQTTLLQRNSNNNNNKIGYFYVCGEEYPTHVSYLKDKKFISLQDYRNFLSQITAMSDSCSMQFSVCGEEFPTNIKGLGGQVFVSVEEYVAFLGSLNSNNNNNNNL
jgi:cAMP-dependent protein kinase regulator